MEVSIIKVLLMLKTMVLQHNQLIHTLLKQEHAKQKVDHSRLLQFRLLRDAQDFKQQLLQDQLVFQLMLQIGANTALVFSVDVELILTMILCLSESPILIGKLRTLGVLDGEKKVLSDLLLEILVVFVSTNLHGSNDSI